MMHALTSLARSGGRSRRRRGFSLVEAVASTMIVGIVLVASLDAMNAVVKTRQTNFGNVQARTLAFDLMAEIMQAAYEEPNQTAKQTFQRGATGVVAIQPITAASRQFAPEPGEVMGHRLAFDDVDDYDGFSESPPKAKDGPALPNGAGWTRAVAVSYANRNTLGPTNKTTDTGLKLITVTVTSPSGATTAIYGLRTRYGSFDETPASNTSFLGNVGVTLQVGSDPAAAGQSAAVLWSKPSVPN